MNVSEFVIKILSETNGLCFLPVAVDGPTPEPIEKKFEIGVDKGYLLLRPRKEE